METPEVDVQLALTHGLSEEEYQWILEKLGRTPTYVELGIYSVMWSEHCSYKNSISELKKLPRKGANLLVEAGEENAGLVDIGDGMAVAFKIESHNHPSAVEPYQGAATGVGGIQRDIFTMGARPICSLNSLRFGSLQDPRVRYLLDGVVRGIGDYGNSFGVPTVAGELYCDPAYSGNPLVNAMSVGIVSVGETISATAKGKGNAVYIVGSSTGRDGIHGATFASEEISEESEAKRPSVQVGDPFTEKLLLEATLEIIKEGLVVGMQDMGAAGITCSSCEMSAKGNSGMMLYLEQVPTREQGMTPYEIMLSESQERMLVVCEPQNAEKLERVFEKWDLHAVRIGEVTDDGRVRVSWNGEIVADVPAEHLVLGGGAPVYKRETTKPEYLKETESFDLNQLPDIERDSVASVLLDLLGSPNIASKEWIYKQYDSTVRTNTVLGPGASDAAIVRVKGTKKGLAVKTDCNSRYVYLNPRRGGQIAVAEAARNVVCSGGTPLAITNCLNFGNPYKPEVYWVFKEAVQGMGEACRALDTPVTGGNVSFYNENPEGAVLPTPTIGMLGLVEDVEAQATTSSFKQPGDHVYVLSPSGWSFRDDLGGSEYLSTVHGLVTGDAPFMDLEEERNVHEAMTLLIKSGVVQSAHDISEGGLAVCLAESAICSEGLGCTINVSNRSVRLDAILFGESQSRIVFTSELEYSRIMQILSGVDVHILDIGVVTNETYVIQLEGEEIVDVNVEKLSEMYRNSIREIMTSA